MRNLGWSAILCSLAVWTTFACGTATTDSPARLADLRHDAATYVVENLISGAISVPVGGTSTVNLNGWRHVKRVVVDAVAYGSAAMVEVVANGEVKGTLHIPATDPAYVVTIAEATRAIEFRHLSGGRVSITRVEATLSKHTVHPNDHGGGLGPDGSTLAGSLSHDVIDLMDEFFPHAPVADWEQSLLPVKIKAGRAWAQANASGDLSGRLREHLVGLLVQMEMAEPYVEKAFHDQEQFDLCVRFLTLRNRLRDLMD